MHIDTDIINGINNIDSVSIIKGKVMTNTGEPLIGATVYFTRLKKGVITDNNGSFTIKLKNGKYNVEVSYVGQEPKKCLLDTRLTSNPIFKIDDNISMDEVVITGKREDQNITKLNMGAHNVSLSEVSKLPSIMGEVDIVKAIQFLPGVQPTSDGGAGFSVRGGGADQNLILLDNATIYNASHMMGFFSVFNNDMVKSADLYKGDMPMRFGGRLSSLLQINTVDEIAPKFSLNASIGNIASKVTINTPIDKNTALIVGARRSYLDLFLKMNDETKDNDLYFYDTNLKLMHKFSNKNRIELSGYLGKDLFGMGGVQTFHYGNSALSLIWKSILSESFSFNLTGNISHYGYGLESKLKNNEMKWTADITDYSMDFNFINLICPNYELNYGVSGVYHKFNPGIVTQPKYDDVVMPNRKAVEFTCYLENKFNMSDRFSAKYGLRVTSFNNIGKALIYQFDDSYKLIDSTEYKKGDIFGSYTRFEPRVGLVYKLSESSSLKGDYVHNVQFIQMANNSSAGSPLDYWFCAGPNVKPQEADIFSLGYFKNLHDNMYETSCELYYKKINHSIDFADHADLLLNEQMEGEIRTGHGEAYGVELMVKKNRGKLTGFIDYTLSRSTRTFDGINDGERYLSPYDKTHCGNIVASYKINDKATLSATFIYATGAPTTYPVGRMKLNEEYYPIYSKRNEYRKPDYHRLDMALSYSPHVNTSKKWKKEWVFSIYNVYNRHNAWSISYDSDSAGPYAEKVYLFGFLPSVSYIIKY